MGGLLIVASLLTVIDRWAFELREMGRLQARIHQAGMASGIASWPAREGEAFGHIAIPRVGVSGVLVEGVAASDLNRAVGHVPGTSWPGDTKPGTFALAGHRDLHFRGLNEILYGDTILVATLWGTFTYVVDTVRIVAPWETEVLTPEGNSRIALITCYPFSFIGPAPRRFVVLGREINRPPHVASR